jgi:hypothetical protein
VEWARAKARADRWTEEAILTTEEMRRNIAFGLYMRNWWTDISDRQTNPDPVALESLRAYAMKRVHHKQDLCRTFPGKWTAVLDRASASPLLKEQVIDALVALPPELRKSSDQPPDTTNSLVLVIEGLGGLALSTDDNVYEPRYVCVPCFASPPSDA